MQNIFATYFCFKRWRCGALYGDNAHKFELREVYALGTIFIMISEHHGEINKVSPNDLRNILVKGLRCYDRAYYFTAYAEMLQRVRRPLTFCICSGLRSGMTGLKCRHPNPVPNIEQNATIINSNLKTLYHQCLENHIFDRCNIDHDI